MILSSRVKKSCLVANQERMRDSRSIWWMKMGDDDGRKVVERILACVNNEFESNVDVVGKDFKLYVTGHR